MKLATSRSARILGVATVLVLAVTGCGADGVTPGSAATPAATPSTPASTAAQRNIVETATAAGSFTTLTSLVEEAGLAGTLANDGPFTVFAPTDAAFSKVPERTLDSLAADPEALKSVLLYHVVDGEALASDVAELDSAETLNGKSVRLRTMDGAVTVNDATVVEADVLASNGVIHVIDEVLIP